MGLSAPIQASLEVWRHARKTLPVCGYRLVDEQNASQVKTAFLDFEILARHRMDRHLYDTEFQRTFVSFGPRHLPDRANDGDHARSPEIDRGVTVRRPTSPALQPQFDSVRNQRGLETCSATGECPDRGTELKGRGR
jgi:hypothetical protein